MAAPPSGLGAGGGLAGGVVSFRTRDGSRVCRPPERATPVTVTAGLHSFLALDLSWGRCGGKTKDASEKRFPWPCTTRSEMFSASRSREPRLTVGLCCARPDLLRGLFSPETLTDIDGDIAKFPGSSGGLG